MVERDRDNLAGVRAGDILVNKYRVDRVLGIGGMGVVVAAYHLQLNERVALKFLLPKMLDDGEAVTRFAREAQAAAKIKNEHVARVSDVGTLDNGAPYMVMEYLDGRDLSAWLRDSGPLSVEEAVDFVLQAGVAVADAHAVGIIHRDLKPANLFCIRRTGGKQIIKVLDFGISKMTVGENLMQGAGTRSAAMMGTPFYMSPEQMRSSRDVTPQTDIWSLGIILYELLSGRTPFECEQVTNLVFKVTFEPPPSLRAARAEVPTGLEAAIFRALEKDVRKRYANVGEFARQLAPFAGARSRETLDRIADITQSVTKLATVPPGSPGASDATDSTLPIGTNAPDLAFLSTTRDASMGTLPGTGRTTLGSGNQRKPRRATVSSALVVAGALCAGFVALGVASNRPSPATAMQAAANLAVPAGAEATRLLSSAKPRVESSLEASASSAPVTSTAAPPLTVTPAVAPGHTPTKSPSSSTKPAPKKVNCTPPYTFDANGYRIYKDECL